MCIKLEINQGYNSACIEFFLYILNCLWGICSSAVGEKLSSAERDRWIFMIFPTSKMQYLFHTICPYGIITERSSKQTHASLMQCICKNERSLCSPFVIQKIALARGMTYAKRGYSSSRQDSIITLNDQPSLHRLVNRPHD